MPRTAPLFKDKVALKTWINYFRRFYKEEENEELRDTLLKLKEIPYLDKGVKKLKFTNKKVFHNTKTNRNIKTTIVLSFIIPRFLDSLSEEEKKEFETMRKNKPKEFKAWVLNREKTVERNFLGIDSHYRPIKALRKTIEFDGEVSQDISPYQFVQKDIRKWIAEQKESIALEREEKEKAESLGLTVEEYRIAHKIKREPSEMKLIPFKELIEIREFMKDRASRLRLQKLEQGKIEEKKGQLGRGIIIKYFNAGKAFYEATQLRPKDWEWDVYQDYVYANAESIGAQNQLSQKLRQWVVFVLNFPKFTSEETLKDSEFYIAPSQIKNLKEIFWNTTHPDRGGGRNLFPKSAPKEERVEEWGKLESEYYSIEQLIQIIDEIHKLELPKLEELSLELIARIGFFTGARIGSRRTKKEAVWQVTSEKVNGYEERGEFIKMPIKVMTGLLNFRWEWIEHLDNPNTIELILYQKTIRFDKYIKYKDEGEWLTAFGSSNIAYDWHVTLHLDKANKITNRVFLPPHQKIYDLIKEYHALWIKEKGYDPHEKGAYFFLHDYSTYLAIQNKINVELGIEKEIGKPCHSFRASFLNYWKSKGYSDAQMRSMKIGVCWKTSEIPKIYYEKRAEAIAPKIGFSEEGY